MEMHGEFTLEVTHNLDDAGVPSWLDRDLIEDRMADTIRDEGEINGSETFVCHRYDFGDGCDDEVLLDHNSADGLYVKGVLSIYAGTLAGVPMAPNVGDSLGFSLEQATIFARVSLDPQGRICTVDHVQRVEPDEFEVEFEWSVDYIDFA